MTRPTHRIVDHALIANRLMDTDTETAGGAGQMGLHWNGGGASEHVTEQLFLVEKL